MLFPFSFMQAQGPSYDADAQAFFNRVAAAGGTLTLTEKTAVNTLVVQMKADGIWSGMKAIYPMVGASTAACAQNLKSSSFTGAFSSGWTFASTGVTSNGTSAYMDSGLNANSNLTVSNAHFSIYIRAKNGTSDQINGVYTGIFIDQYNATNVYYGIGVESTVTVSSQIGMFNVNALSPSTKLFRNGSSLQSITSGGSLPSANLNLGRSGSGTPYYWNGTLAFSSIGDGLTDAQASNFYTAVQTFNQTLSRSVGAQIVSDADAQAYINRVYTAGGTLTNTEANAVNQLTIDMKAAGVWTAMKAVYPMVGSSAAACAQNLKSASFTGTFSSGWTFASTGVTPNGTSAYMNTGFNNQSNWTSTANGSMGFISRTNPSAATQCDMGSGQDIGSGANSSTIYSRFTGDQFYSGLNCTTVAPGSSNASSIGFFVTSRTISTAYTRHKRGSSTINLSVTDSIGTNPNITIYLGAGNNNATSSPLNYSNREFDFAFIGDGLTQTQVDNYWTALQTFNTTLSR